ncbi:uncharacterized protein LOC124815287 [Hydra vulgaris]|uniref:uncharacterized protein LOC124815287 n=1 Tax=Hydra vulgaris TaxID=6087 RepID=UPI001F5E832B|nr:uncharacterized protein LOC124815287 isoform X1 [Hydra vulgaris]
MLKTLRRSGVKFESNMEKALDEKSKLLSNFYVTELLDFQEKEKDNDYATVKRHLVYIEDITTFLDFVMKYRGHVLQNTFVKVGIDSGGGSLKVIVKLFDPTKDRTEDSSSLGSYSGANTSLVLAYCERVSENHSNMTMIVEKLKLHECKYSLASDMKLINILLGISAHGGKYACAWCEGSSELFSGELRTFQSLNNYYELYSSAGSPVKRMKEYKNVINPCLLKIEDKSLSIIREIPLPELHLLMGFVNHVAEFIMQLWPGFIDWVKSIGCLRKGFHGGTFEGNTCREILKSCDKLELIIPVELYPLLETMRKFNKVVHGVFSYKLDPNYSILIESFTQSYKDAQDYCREFLGKQLTVTWKVHAVTAHLETFVDLSGLSLGQFNEQTSESCHYKMKSVINRFGVSQYSNKHKERSKRIAEVFSSNNL